MPRSVCNGISWYLWNCNSIENLLFWTPDSSDTSWFYIVGFVLASIKRHVWSGGNVLELSFSKSRRAWTVLLTLSPQLDIGEFKHPGRVSIHAVLGRDRVLKWSLSQDLQHWRMSLPLQKLTLLGRQQDRRETIIPTVKVAMLRWMVFQFATSNLPRNRTYSPLTKAQGLRSRFLAHQFKSVSTSVGAKS